MWRYAAFDVETWDFLPGGDIVLQVCGIKVHDHAIAIQLIERRMVIGGAIELLVERKEDVSKRGSGMRLWRRPVAPGPILGLATE